MERRENTRLYAGFLTVCLALASALVLVPGLEARANGLVEETVGATRNLYDRYALNNYSLDFWVDTSADWLPWNWGEGIGKTVDYALYKLTNMLWQLALLFSYFIGYLVQQAYDLDFIDDTADKLGANIQAIAGVSSGGFRSHGLLPSMLLVVILLTGVYIIYVAVVKAKTTRAVTTMLAFLVTAVFGIGVLAYSGSYIDRINGFQKEFNNEVLTISNSLTVGGGSGGTDGVRDNLFSVMIYQPYLLLQYGTTDTEAIGQDRIDELLETEFGTEERQTVVENEVSTEGNEYMSLNKTGDRLGSVLLILILDIVIGVCVGIFAGMMIFSQILFILFVSFLPVALVFSLFPNNQGVLMMALRKAFEALLNKAGITLILSIVFGLSTMAYELTESHSFLWVMFLQLVIYIGALMKSRELLSFMTIGSNGEDRAARRVGGRIGSMLRTVVLGKALADHSKATAGKAVAGAASKGSTSLGAGSPGMGAGGSGAGSPGMGTANHGNPAKRSGGAADQRSENNSIYVDAKGQQMAGQASSNRAEEAAREKAQAQRPLDGKEITRQIPKDVSELPTVQEAKTSPEKDASQRFQRERVAADQPLPGTHTPERLTTESPGAELRREKEAARMEERTSQAKTQAKTQEEKPESIRRAQTHRKGQVSYSGNQERGNGRNRFSNAPEREYDMTELEKKLLGL